MNQRTDLLREATRIIGGEGSTECIGNYFSATAKLNGSRVTVVDIAYIEGSALVARERAKGRKVEFDPLMERAYIW